MAILCVSGYQPRRKLATSELLLRSLSVLWSKHPGRSGPPFSVHLLCLCRSRVSDDRNAMRQCALQNLVESLPTGVCVIGDAAYIPTEHMVPVYQGSDKLIPLYDNFNFYASQCRIRVEMAFGIMQMKWGLLSRPVGCSLKNMIWLAQAIARLHNFCINERLETAGPTTEPVTNVNGTGYIPSVPHDVNGDPVRLDNVYSSCEGMSYLREFMANRVKRLQLKRPSRNKKRRREEES
ncbi:expressed unknown protein [Seminavis robusta]|uniref:DDE Tnp4 domain-containing protein n=1 Tax=Seminavis robusta TaxID=568900 RepID=A0A9N8HHI6_9STRA|nr:expressed unknown protein [Seminavis robusta]|eukprot:Sro538_g162661.1  (236) ;mRNA; f:48816-49523